MHLKIHLLKLYGRSFVCLFIQGGDVAIKLSYILERCPHFDSDSSSTWFTDTPSSPDYSVLAKWGRMTTDFDGYATRLSNAMNEIRSVRERNIGWFCDVYWT